MDNYDRMNPAVEVLLERLEEYSLIDYGVEAYPLSRAEAKVLLDTIFGQEQAKWVGVCE